MFSGWYALSMDDKGRIAVPAVFRQLLTKMESGTLYLTPFSHDAERPHIEVFPTPAFAKLADQIDALEDAEQAELLKQEIIGRSLMVDLDSQGRMVLPQWLRDEAKLGGRVVVEGQIGRFDIWDEARYQARRADSERLKQALKLIKR